MRIPLKSIFLFFWILIASGAIGQTITPQIGGGIGVSDGGISNLSVPAWVLNGATVGLDFANNRSYGCASITACVGVTRASNETNLLPSSPSGFAYTTYGNNVLAFNNGLLPYEARTNQLLNSAAPATQTTASLGTGAYTLWVNGSGTATMSSGTGTGCGTGAASQGTPVNFTITIAGTCTVTVAGSLNAFQLEAGAFGTSFIATTGAPAARAADNNQFLGPALALVNGSVSFSAVIVTSATPAVAASNVDLLFAGAGTQHYMFVFAGAPTQVVARVSPTNVTATLGSGSYSSTAVKAGFSYDAVAHTVSTVGNNGTVATGSLTYANNSNPFLGSTGAGSYYDAPISQVFLFSGKITDTALKAATQ